MIRSGIARGRSLPQQQRWFSQAYMPCTGPFPCARASNHSPPGPEQKKRRSKAGNEGDGRLIGVSLSVRLELYHDKAAHSATFTPDLAIKIPIRIFTKFSQLLKDYHFIENSALAHRQNCPLQGGHALSRPLGTAPMRALPGDRRPAGCELQPGFWFDRPPPDPPPTSRLSMRARRRRYPRTSPQNRVSPPEAGTTGASPLPGETWCP